jgi:F-type H+-transporting ATPase subunit a
MSTLLAAADPTSHILPHDLFRLGDVWVTNHMLMALVAGVLMVVVFPLTFHRPVSDAPSGARNFFEAILEFLRSEVFRPALKEHTDRFVPFLWTLFFFILFCNLLGTIPLGDLLGLLSNGKLAHVGGAATGNVSTTGALALCALVAIHVSGVMQVARQLMRGTYGHHAHEHDGATDAAGAHASDHGRPHPGPTGARGMNPLLAVILALPLYLWNFAPHPFRPEPGQSRLMWIPDLLVWSMLLVLELVGALIKPFALMIRLFANMVAGHLVLAVLIGFIPVTLGVFAQIGIGIPVTVLSLLIRLLELFVAFLQAYIFTFLTTLFIAGAVAPEH